MANDLTVRFGGDLSQLNATLAQAKANLASFAPASSSQAKASLDALNASLAQARQNSESWLPTLRDVSVTLASITYVTKEAVSGLVSLTTVLAQASAAGGRITLAIDKAALNAAGSAIGTVTGAFGDFIASGDHAERSSRLLAQSIDFNNTTLGQLSNTLRAASNESDRFALSIAATTVAALETARESFLGVRAAISDYLAGVALVRQGTVDLELTTITAAGRFDVFASAVAASGNKFGPVTETLDHFTRELSKIDGMTKTAADSIQASITSIPNYSVGSNELIVNFLQQTATNAEDAQKKVQALVAALKSTKDGGAALADALLKTIDFKDLDAAKGKLEDLVTESKQLGQNFADPAQAKAFYETLITKSDEYNRSAQQGFKEHAEALAKLGTLGGALMLPMQGQLQKQGEINDAVRQANLLWQIQSQASKAILADMTKMKEFQDALNAGKTPSDTITDIESRIGTLKGGLATRKSVDDVGGISSADKDLAIRTAVLEADSQSDRGVIAQLYSYKNRLNAGYGNYGDTLGDVIKKPAAYSAVDAPGGAFDPAKAAAVNPDGFQYKRIAALYDKVFGDNPVDDPTGGATHYYNRDLAAPSWAQGMGNERKIGDHTFGNPDGRPVVSSDDAARAKEGIEKANGELRTQNAIKEGGSAIDKANLEILERTATATQDDVAAAHKRVDVAKEQLASYGLVLNAAGKVQKDESKPMAATAQEQAKVTTAYYQAVDAARKADVAKDVASTDLKLAAAQKGSREELDLTIQKARSQQSLYAVGSTQYSNYQKEIVTAQKKYDEQQTADKVSQLTIQFDAAKSALASEAELIKERARGGEISGLEEVRLLLDNTQRKLAIEQAYYADKGRLEATNLNKLREDLQKGQLAAQEAAQNMKRINQQTAMEVQQFWKQGFEGIASSISSSLIAIQNRTGTWRDLMRSAVESIEGYFLQAGLKMAADFAATQAKELTMMVATQAGITGAVASGEATRTGIVNSSAAIQAASQSTAALKSIITSAAQAAAGTFANLSALLGPLAAAPAAAVESTVLGFAGMIPAFDIGAYRLPSDTFAMVHRNELVMPAGPAEAFRTMLESGGGGGTGGGDTHVYNITAVDAQSFASLAKRNPGALTEAVMGHLRRNPSFKR